jgi:hypothetical protein
MRDASSCDIPFSYVRLFVQQELLGWTFSAYDLKRHTWILCGEPSLADSEEQAKDAAEAWAFGAGLLNANIMIQWKRKA